MNNSNSIFNRAKKVIPGGVNSPVRAFGAVGIDPIFVKSALGSKIYDVDGNEYIDYICSWGPLIFGHSKKEFISGVEEIMMRGTSYGLPTEIEVSMAELIVDAYPSIDMVRMVSSGTEATMSAIRLARGYTKKNKIIKFEGCYHGHSDSLLVKSGSGTLTYFEPTSLGVPSKVVEDTLVAKYNDIESVKKLIEMYGDDIATVIVEPVAGNMGVVAPDIKFMKELRRITEDNNILLIFDEVITGFRVSYGGAQEVLGIKPDITCLGKIIGGGLPVGAYGGRKEIMELVSPLGGVYQAGTLSGNPLAMHMGYKTLKALKNDKSLYTKIENLAIYFENELNRIIQDLKAPLTVTRFKGMLCIFFIDNEIKSYDDVKGSDLKSYAEFFRKMLKEGVILPPAQFEGLFLSDAHTKEDVETTIVKMEKVLRKMY
ncbi:glutamate-1-semialdehyde 2,1-aminomutase [Helicovermis profundi]|uniref:Glutamate-1-semialdehyde 2,1-aminomutase n=1 Tax=Helicovermis profundi TaxID=3065157 RepID=A0AAU9EA65_9FIRM|nr:glutamate-1-semialdehyde 2,1-aminomutase [Clostridia bacterium S502]